MSRSISNRDVSDPQSGPHVRPRPCSRGSLTSRLPCVRHRVYRLRDGHAASRHARLYTEPRTGVRRARCRTDHQWLIPCSRIVMSIIKPRTRGRVFVPYRARLERENHETLYAYAAFPGEDAEYVVNAVIDTV